MHAPVVDFLQRRQPCALLAKLARAARRRRRRVVVRQRRHVGRNVAQRVPIVRRNAVIGVAALPLARMALKRRRAYDHVAVLAEDAMAAGLDHNRTAQQRPALYDVRYALAVLQRACLAVKQPPVLVAAAHGVARDRRARERRARHMDAPRERIHTA
eukprot:278644-Chlamydomonas_euryale.AAC.1